LPAPIANKHDSIRCIQVIAGVLGRAGQAGTKQRLAAAAEGQITFRPATRLVKPEEAEEAVAPEVMATLEDGLMDDAKETEVKLDEARNGERSIRDLKQVS
jgi:small subunit ribosomal protein S2